MHYYHMTNDDILKHSTKYLLYLYEEYPKRVGEYMGIFDKVEEKNNNVLSEEDYPEFLQDPDQANDLVKQFKQMNNQ